MAKEIKQKIVLEGEKEYNQAIKDAQRNLRTLKSELKAETAELGKNATEQQKAEAKIKSLKKQIAEQEKIVQTYTAALAEVREKYADNEDEIAKWEVKLNNARTALANMKSGLEDVGQGFQSVKGNAETGVVAAQSFAQAFGGLADIGESISSAIEDTFFGVIDIVKGAVGELWGLIVDTAAKANNWTDLAGYFGSTAEQMQLMDRAVTEAGGSFDSLINMVSRLSFGGKNDKISEWFGVSDANYKNNMDYTLAVLDAMAKKREQWGTGGKWDTAMSEIFGAKKSADVSWFVQNLDLILQKRDELQESGGYLMDEGELENMNEVHIQLKTIEDRWDALKSKFAAGFGNTTLDITTNVQGSLDALAKYFDADTPEEREAAMEELHEAILATFEAVAEAIREGIGILESVSEELKQSKDPIVKGVGNILGGIVEALKWFTEDNARNVVTALEIIAGFWLTGKGLAMGAKIAEIVGNIRTIQLFNALGGGAAGAAGSAGAAGAGEATGAAAGGLGLAGLGGLIGLGVIGASAAWAADRRLNHREDVLGTEENLAKSTGGNSTLMDTFAQWVQAQNEWSKIEDLTVEATDEEMEALNLKIKSLWDELNEQEEFGSMWDSYQAWREEKGMRSDQWELPASWWQSPGSDNGITGSDLQNFRGLPGQLQLAAKAGVAAGVAALRVTMDGRTVGQLVAPYVSEYIGRELED